MPPSSSPFEFVTVTLPVTPTFVTFPATDFARIGPVAASLWTSSCLTSPDEPMVSNRGSSSWFVMS